jgi:hypothetical protein
MTPTQYYFPYFFDLDFFNKAIKPLGLSSYLTYDSKTKMPDELILTKYKFFNLRKSKTALYSIPFGATLMVQNNNLFYWKTDYDSLDITQIKLSKLTNTVEIKNHEINLLHFSIGHNKIDTTLDLIDFVTYIRKADLKYDQDYYEKFTIVFIHKNDINIIPFDWFNKLGGDYGYVWPAVARLNKEQKKLHGQGMRMDKFTVDINNKI